MIIQQVLELLFKHYCFVLIITVFIALTFRYVNGELKENTSAFAEDFLLKFDQKNENSIISDLVSSSDSGDKKAGIFMIGLSLQILSLTYKFGIEPVTFRF